MHHRIFILEGLATIVAGIFCWWMIFDWVRFCQDAS